MNDKGMDFLQAKSPFLGVMCIPTVAIATNKLVHIYKKNLNNDENISA